MIRKIIFLTYLVCISFACASKEYSINSGEIEGILRMIKEDQPLSVELRGEGSQDDVAKLNRLPGSVVSLDLSNLEISGLSVPPYALFATNIKQLILPSSIITIGEAAFAETPLEKISIPAGVTKLAPRCFYKCGSLTEVIFEGSVISEIPEECFYGCSKLESINIPTSLNRIRNRALMLTGLKSLSIPGVKNIGDFALANNPLLTEIALSESVAIGDGAFYNTPVLSCIETLPGNLPVLAFAGSGQLPEAVEVNQEIIGEAAFAQTEISTLTIGKEVKEIDRYAFRNVKNLQTVDVTGRGSDIPRLDAEAFSGVDVSEVLLNVVPETMEEWRAAEGWKEFKFDETSRIENASDSAIAIAIEGHDGRIKITASESPDLVSVYSISGMVLYESTHCSAVEEIGPFTEKEVIVRVKVGKTVKIGTYFIR